ncbi:MAG: hypothetical protein Kow0013_16580 [Pararhodobacter sp.]
MKKLLLTLGVISTVAAAQADAKTVLTDANEDGMFSYEELLVSFPDLTADAFGAADTNGDGQLDADELKAAQAAGTIPA